MGQGPQDNESAAEQAKDEQISDFIRGQCKYTLFPIEDEWRFRDIITGLIALLFADKSQTGKDFFVKDKDTTFSKN